MDRLRISGFRTGGRHNLKEETLGTHLRPPLAPAATPTSAAPAASDYRPRCTPTTPFPLLPAPADCSPLAQSVPAFSSAAAFEEDDRQQKRLDKGLAPLAGGVPAASAAGGDRIPAHPPSGADGGRGPQRQDAAGAPAGSAWNPWQGVCEWPQPCWQANPCMPLNQASCSRLVAPAGCS